MKIREVLLVVLLLVAGFVLYEIETGGSGTRWGLVFDDGEGFFGTGRAYSFEEMQTLAAPLPARLDVVNSHGWVEVRGSDQETVQLTFKKRIWRRTEEQARETASQLHYVLAKAGDHWTLSTNRADFKRKSFETGFILTVPKRLRVSVVNSYGDVVAADVKEAAVENSHGRVSASSIGGPCTIETSYEDVQARNISGECRIINAHADIQAGPVAGQLHVEDRYGTVSIEDIDGPADVAAGNAAVKVRRVKGSVTVETSYEKVALTDVGAAKLRLRHSAVEADGVMGDLDVQTSYQPVRASRVQGNLVINGNNVEVTAAGVGGREISVTTSYEKVELSDFSAKVSLTARNGNVILRPADLKLPMDIRNAYGDIDLFWPAGAAMSLEARSKGGAVRWGLPDKPTLEKSNGVSVIEAFGGTAGAADVSLSTSYGDIHIEPGGRKL